MVFQTQVPISLVILVIGIQDLYTSKYKYTISFEMKKEKHIILLLPMSFIACVFKVVASRPYPIKAEA